MACAPLGDMARFGDLAIYFIFAKNGFIYTMTQVITRDTTQTQKITRDTKFVLRYKNANTVLDKVLPAIRNAIQDAISDAIQNTIQDTTWDAIRDVIQDAFRDVIQDQDLPQV